MAFFGKFALIANALSLLGLGVFVLLALRVKPPEYSNPLEYEKLKNEAIDLTSIPPINLHPKDADRLIVNLNSETQRLRFLSLGMSVLPFSKDFAEQVPAIIDDKGKSVPGDTTGKINFHREIKPLIHDTVIDLASNMSVEELNSITGKLLFSERIKRRVNNHYREINPHYNKPVIKKIFFTDYVIQ